MHPNLIRVLSVATFFAAWEYWGRQVDPVFLAPPSTILAAGIELSRDGTLLNAMKQSLLPFATGLALTIVVGITIGIAMAQWSLVEYVLDPFVNAFYAIPRIALVPLVILWVGLEFAGKVTILVSSAIFPVIINTFAGVKDVRGSMLEIGRAYGATETQIFFKITLPASVPFIFAGIRLGVGLAIIGIIIGEFFTAMTGLGGMIVEFANNFATAKLFVPVIVIALVGIALTGLVSWLEQLLSGWRISERERF
jgi:NitT/TauT family transport system permease protein